MAWTPGTINLGASFQNNVAEALDARQFVSTAEDLEGIGAAYNGMIVHVGDTKKNYVCVNKDGLVDSVDGGGNPLSGVWKEIADTGYVDTAISDLVGDAEGTLNTLEEIGTAIGDNPDFIGAMNTLVGTKADTAHTHAVTGITNVGATTGQVVTFDGNNVGWADASGGGDTSTLVDVSAPTGGANKVILYSADETSAESMPDHLYLFDELEDEDDAIDSGRRGTSLSAGNTGLKASTSGVDFTMAGLGGMGNAAVFAPGNSQNIRVGGASAPYWLSGNSTDAYLAGGATARADFEIQFLFAIANGGLDRTHTLLSVDPSNHQTDVEGFYSVLLVASSSSGGSNVAFEYYDDTTDKVETVEWTIPGTLQTESAASSYHLAISFFEDNRGVDTTDINPSVGKFRCYLDGVVLEDKNSAGALSVAGQFEKLGKASGSGVLHPLYLGQYLNGLPSGGGPAGLFRFEDNLADATGGATGTLIGSPSGGGNQYETDFDSIGTSFGKQLRLSNTNSSSSTNMADLRDFDLGTGAFTLEFWFSPIRIASHTGILCFRESGGAGNAKNSFSLKVDGTTNAEQLQLRHIDSTGTTTDAQFGYPNWQTPYIVRNDIAGPMKHWALVRTATSGGNQDFRIYIDGAIRGTITKTAIDLTGKTLRLGQAEGLFSSTLYTYALDEGVFEEVRITQSEVYTGTTMTPAAPTTPHELGLNPATRFFEGKLHEFAVWNHRCLHNTSDKFARPTAPTRSTPLSVASVVDSENTSSPILTTSNLGMLLPKAVEGLADGTAWNDKGVVKIAPLTGDLDAGGDATLSLAAGTAPAATAGVAKIYAKNVVAPGDVGGDALYNFTSGDPTADDIRTGNAGSIVGAPNTGAQYATNHDSIGVEWGDQLRISNANYVGTPGTPGNLFDIPDHGIGAGSYTVEFFYDPVSVGTTGGAVGVFCIGYSVWDELLDVALWGSNLIRVRDVINPSGTPSERIHYFHYNWSSDSGSWKHWAICREVNKPTTGDYRITAFINGAELTPYDSSGQNNPNVNVGTGIVNYNLSTNDYLSMGGYRVGQSVFGRPIEAVYDSVNITRSCKYPQGSPPSPVPDAPFQDSTPPSTTKLFAMDSSGNETQLTP